MVNHLRKDYLLDVMGNPFRASFKADIPTMMTTIQTQFGGSFVQLLRIYVRYINASLRWHFGLGQESEQARNKLFTNAMVDFAPNAGFNHRYLDYIHGNTPGYLRSERLLSASLTVIIFLLCESYLAIMVSYMLDVKYQDHLQTIDDLERSSISYCLKPGEDLEIYKRFFNVFSPTLVGRIIRPKTSNHWYDIESCTWMLRHEVAQVFLGSEQNYDRNTMRRKMYMLPQMLSCMSRLHSVSRLRPFREHFLAVQQRMIDAGFWQHWNDAVMSAVLIRKWDTFSSQIKR
ncbi:conserved hypothetical protein [Culex quinquefasciatus]|uniref:Uncharacterized protein n=1 Tax=Culex quinquefasciatus TaxID=7176 RepID=B0WGG7_CULQU|nr:conserved hypothetical protein [Culex quinquefasciatus]|eukprot:XP_001847801.1 conserved hypothetical protein [Culex quinquefasciatus]